MYFERSYIWFAIEIAFTLVKSKVIPRIVDYTHFSILCSLVHTVPVFFVGATVLTPGTPRDYTVATPASTALNRDTLC